jgi:hypothetical protein
MTVAPEPFNRLAGVKVKDKRGKGAFSSFIVE